MIQFFHVYKSFGDQFALQDVSVQIQKGEFVYLTGPSGAGKTTFLNLIFAAQRPNRGQILFNGQNITRLSPRSIPFLRRNIGVVFQDFKLIDSRTLGENVGLALEVLGTPRDVIDRRVNAVLGIVGLRGRAGEYPPTLSGGEQQRVALARAFVIQPRVLFADEPTGNLDDENGSMVMQLMLDLVEEEGTTLLYVTHSSFFAELADEVWEIHSGELSTPSCNDNG